MKTRWLMLIALCPWLAMATSCSDADRTDAANPSATSSPDTEDAANSTEAPGPGAPAEQLACTPGEDLHPGLPPAPVTADACPDVGLDTVTLTDYAHVPGSFVVGRILDIRPDTGEALLDAHQELLVPREECDAVAPRLVMELEILQHFGSLQTLDHVDTIDITLGGHESLPTETGWHSLDDGGWCWTEGTTTVPAPGMIIGGPVWYHRHRPSSRFTFAITPHNRIFAVDDDGLVALQESTTSDCAPLDDLWSTIDGMDIDTLMDLLATARSGDADESRMRSVRELLGVSDWVDSVWGLPHMYPTCEGHQPPPEPTEPTACPPARCHWPHQAGVQLPNGCYECRELAPTGEPCEADLDCYFQNFCDDGICTLLYELACTSRADCPRGVPCMGERCAPYCSPDRECLGEAVCMILRSWEARNKEADLVCGFPPED